jgi:predicted RNase H-like HicB family nuclease
LALKLRDIKTEVMREKDGSYTMTCSALGVYSIGKTLRDAKRNFEEALDLHLSVLREKATRQIATVAPER